MTSAFARPDHSWAVRVSRISAEEARAYARNHAFSIGNQASLRPVDAHPSAIEYLLGAFGGDLLAGFQKEAGRRGVELRAMEISLSGRLENILVQLGVIGEEGSPRLEAIRGVLYVRADCDQPVLDGIWSAVLLRSPLYHTLSPAARLDLQVRLMP